MLGILLALLTSLSSPMALKSSYIFVAFIFISLISLICTFLWALDWYSNFLKSLPGCLIVISKLILIREISDCYLQHNLFLLSFSISSSGSTIFSFTQNKDLGVIQWVLFLPTSTPSPSASLCELPCFYCYQSMIGIIISHLGWYGSSQMCSLFLLCFF